MKKKWCVLPIIINHFFVSTLRCLEYERNETNDWSHKNEENEKRINKNPYIYVHKGGGIPLRKEIASFDPIKSRDTEGQPVSGRFILLLVSLTWGDVCSIIY